MDPDAESLEEYLGDFRFYLDFYTKQGPNGLEVRGGPQRWRVKKANWKIAAENFAGGDMYHTPQTHTSVVEIGLFREPKANKRKDGATYWAGRGGGGTTYKLPEGGSFEDRMSYVGYPADMISRAKATWTEQQQQVVGTDGFMISPRRAFPTSVSCTTGRKWRTASTSCRSFQSGYGSPLARTKLRCCPGLRWILMPPRQTLRRTRIRLI